MGITCLDLSWNGLSDVSTAQPAAGLEQNNTLKDLRLKRNTIRAGGARALAQMLCHNKCLEELVLDGNPIGSTGGYAMLAVLLDPSLPPHYSCKLDDPLERAVIFELHREAARVRHGQNLVDVKLDGRAWGGLDEN